MKNLTHLLTTFLIVILFIACEDEKDDIQNDVDKQAKKIEIEKLIISSEFLIEFDENSTIIGEFITN